MILTLGVHPLMGEKERAFCSCSPDSEWHQPWPTNRTGENRTGEPRPVDWTLSWALPWTPSWDVSWELSWESLKG